MYVSREKRGKGVGEKGGELDVEEGSSSVSIVTHRGENRRTVGTVTERSREWREVAKRSGGGGVRNGRGRRREREEAWGRWLLRYGRHHHPSHPIVNSEAAVPNLSPCVLVRTVFYRCLLLQVGSNTDISALPALYDALASAPDYHRTSLVPLFSPSFSRYSFPPVCLSGECVFFASVRGKTRTRMKRIGRKGKDGGGGSGRRRAAYRFPHKSFPRI